MHDPEKWNRFREDMRLQKAAVHVEIARKAL
jgi:hypothetical protein